MGCCASSDNKIPPPPHPHPNCSVSKSTMTPPPPPLPPPPLDDEEETVKEVLSETHIPVKFPPKHFLQEIQPLLKNNNDVIKPISIHRNPTADEKASETAATVNERRDNGGTGEVRHKSPSKYRRERAAVGKSPARGSGQSPVRYGSMNGRAPRIVEARGESSAPAPGQRSRSPANRTGSDGGTRNAVGRSPSLRKAGKSLSRVGSDLNRRGEGGKWGEPTTRNESLESPLVSLECFIFL